MTFMQPPDALDGADHGAVWILGGSGRGLKKNLIKNLKTIVYVLIAMANKAVLGPP
jgi:hypothetical protein